jgi:RNA polymerase sigma-70 factor (ECF subfamily)
MRTASPVVVPSIARVSLPRVDDPDDDTRLVAAAQAGSHAAFAALVGRHGSRVRGLLFRLCGDPVLTEDLAQEVFLRAYRGLAGFEARARLATWLHRIAVNLVLNHRARAPVVAALSDGGLELASAAPDDALGPTRAVLRRDLGAAIAQLPQAYRRVVELHYARELGYAEIADALAMPLGTVKTNLRRAKAQLRGLLPEWSPTWSPTAAAA